MLEAYIHGNATRIEFKGDQVEINGAGHSLDVLTVEAGKYLHLIHNNSSYLFEVLSFDKETKSFNLGFEGKSYEVKIRDRFDQLLHSLGLDQVVKSGVNEVKAPMPGLVLSVRVQEGQEVSKGEPLLILEAMKMENIIKSPANGTVRQILIGEKQTVEKNQSLILFQ